MMAASTIILSELERDALTELVNIGVGRAAASLRAMIGREVMLSVPSIEIISHLDASALISERETDELIAVHQDFSGVFAGRALLIFPQVNSLDLVRAVMGEDTSDEDAAEMEQEALAETANVILNGCLGTMANMLRQPLAMTLPSVRRTFGAGIFAPDDNEEGDGTVLFLYINFSVLQQNLRGYIAMLMDLESISILRLMIRDFIESVMGDDAEATG
jgi:chemotaxis protein CheC